ncbi:MAG: hypothetical protein HYV07_26735 [Deltaproteobacteria bacterium]|nr:hypothetical protein [Deltaproteobacteria bacterium]
MVEHASSTRATRGPRRVFSILGTLSVALVWGASAIAQPETKPAEGQQATLSIVEEAASIPSEEKKSRAEAMLAEARDAMKRADQLLAQAQQGKDVVQLNCVQQNHTQIKGLLKIADQSAVRMYEALAKAADQQVNREYTKILVAHRKILKLKAELEQCVGKVQVYEGETSVTVRSDPGDVEDPTDDPIPPPGPSVPPIASPF